MSSDRTVQAALVVVEHRLRKFELTIWEKAEHWRLYEIVLAVDETAARREFAKTWGRGYRLMHVHAIG